MRWHVLFVFLALPLFAQCADKLPPARYETRWFKQDLDHFNYQQRSIATFQQRYLVVDKYWRPGGPIFFYTGNEGDIVMFYNNTGVMFDMAPEFGALLIFAEHRYYGKTLPFGSESFTTENLQYCTIEQALADFANLMEYLQKEYKSPSKEALPIILFGGSYGGMLAAWMRLKYPHLAAGAISSSGPILQFPELYNPPTAYAKIVTDDFEKANPRCPPVFRRAFQRYQALGKTSFGLQLLSETFRTCKPLRGGDDVKKLYTKLIDGIDYLAMLDYPYATDFLHPLPAWPVRVSCERMLMHATDDTDDDRALMQGLAAATGVYFNYTGRIECMDIGTSGTPRLGYSSWDYQSCTEIFLVCERNGVTDFFLPQPWNLNHTLAHCRKRFKGIIPRPRWAMNALGGKAWLHKRFHSQGGASGVSNIIFTQGELDPWRAGGVQKSINPTVIALVMRGAAHHLDLRFANPLDPPDVVQARQIFRREIRRWIAEAE